MSEESADPAPIGHRKATPSPADPRRCVNCGQLIYQTQTARGTEPAHKDSKVLFCTDGALFDGRFTHKTLDAIETALRYASSSYVNLDGVDFDGALAMVESLRGDGTDPDGKED